MIPIKAEYMNQPDIKRNILGMQFFLKSIFLLTTTAEISTGENKRSSRADIF
jgi:hypothetical protein